MRIHWLAVLACVYLAGCSGDPQGAKANPPEPAAPDAGGLDAGPPSTTQTDSSTEADVDAGLGDDCQESVCFAWDPKEPEPLDSDEQMVFDICGIFNLAAHERCPGGFECGDSIRLGMVDYYEAPYTYPVCETQGASPYRLDVNLAPPAEPDSPPVAVTLTPTLNGEPWPAGSPGHGEGSLNIWSNESKYGIRVELPPEEAATLDVELPVGTYRVFAMLRYSGPNQSLYPTTSREGTLVVKRSGRAAVPFEATRLSLRIAQDGADLPALAADERMSVTFDGRRHQWVSRIFAGGEVPSVELALDPDVYAIKTYITPSRTGDGLLLNGNFVLQETLDVSGSSMSVRYNLETTVVSGTILVDGSELPPASKAGQVVLQRDGGVAVLGMPVGQEQPSRFSGRTYTGTYSVVYDADGTNMPGIPAMQVRVRSEYRAGEPLELSLSTARLRGEVMLNETKVASTTDGLHSLGLSTSNHAVTWFTLPTRGPRTFDIRVFNLPYNVYVAGFGDPDVTWPVAVAHTPNGETQRFNVNAHNLSLSFTVDGTNPPDGWYRGQLMLRHLAPPEGFVPPSWRIGLYWPATGQMTYSGLLPDGPWRIAHRFESSEEPDYTALPTGDVILGETTITEDMTQSYNVELVEVEGRLLRGGVPLPTAEPGADRGRIAIETALAGTMGGTNLVVPGSGDPTYRTRVYPGIHHVWYTCSHENGCDSSLTEMNYYAYWGIALR